MLKDKRCLGVTWYGEQLQCVLLEKMMQGIVVVDQWRCLASEDLSQYALFKKTNACLGLPHQAVASARIELPSDTLPKTMTAHIELKSEALFQKKYDDLIIEYEREGLGQDKQQWQLYAIEKTILQRYLEKLMPSSVRLLWIEPEMQGLARLAFFCQAQSKIISVMNLEHNILSVAVLFEGKIKLKRVVPVASDQVDDVAEALNLLCLEIKDFFIDGKIAYLVNQTLLQCQSYQAILETHFSGIKIPPVFESESGHGFVEAGLALRGFGYGR